MTQAERRDRPTPNATSHRRALRKGTGYGVTAASDFRNTVALLNRRAPTTTNCAAIVGASTIRPSQRLFRRRSANPTRRSAIFPNRESRTDRKRAQQLGGSPTAGTLESSIDLVRHRAGSEWSVARSRRC
jgi:hypothetical protein